jgi:hypothetical protein
MPQISRDKNVENNNKTHTKTIKNTASGHLRHASRARHLLDEQHTQSTDTVLSNNKTRASCDDNNEDKNYHLHSDKN